MARHMFRTAALLALVAAPVACDSGTDPVVPAAVELLVPVDVLPAGQTVQLEAVVEDEDGNIIPDPDVDFETSSSGVASVSETGLVTANGEGQVTFTATAGAASDQGSLFVFAFQDLCRDALNIPLNQPLRANFQVGDCDQEVNDGSYTDWYYFELDQERTVTIDLESGDFDAYMWLADEQGIDLATDDNSGGGTDARIQATLPAGVYFVLANGYAPNTGFYTLTVSTSGFAADRDPGAAVLRARSAPGLEVRVR